ncbi:MAG: APC family permease [Fuerstiella sp.]
MLLENSNSQQPTSSSPAPHLSMLSLTALVVAGMIGSGIYTTTGYALADLQSAEVVLLAWCVAGMIAICGAISYGELANRVLESGGEYLYLTKFVHPLAGFLAGWVSALAGFTAAAALAAVTFEEYAVPDGMNVQWLPPGSWAVGLVVLLTTFHAIGIRTGTISQNLVVIAKLTALVGLIGWVFWLWPNWFVNQQQPAAPANQLVRAVTPLASFSWFAFATSTMWISFSFTGFNSAIYVAGESVTGVSGIRRSMIVGTVVVTVLYLVLNVIFLYAADPAAMAGQSNVAVLCVEGLGSEFLPRLLRIVICLGLASSVSSMLMMGPRVYRRMADDGVFPSALVPAGIHFRLAIVVQGAAIVVVTLIAGLQDLLSYLSMTLSLCSAGTVGTVLFCRRDQDGRVFPKARAWVRLATWVYFLASILIAGISCYGNPRKAVGTAVTVLTGVIIFQFLKPGQPDGDLRG